MAPCRCAPCVRPGVESKYDVATDACGLLSSHPHTALTLACVLLPAGTASRITMRVTAGRATSRTSPRQTTAEPRVQPRVRAHVTSRAAQRVGARAPLQAPRAHRPPPPVVVVVALVDVVVTTSVACLRQLPLPLSSCAQCLLSKPHHWFPPLPPPALAVR